MYTLVYSLYLLVLSSYLHKHIKVCKITPVAIFLLLQGIMFLGMVTAPQIVTPHARKLSILYFPALLFFVIGVMFSDKTQRTNNASIFDLAHMQIDDVVPSKKKMLLVWILVLISVFMSVYLFASSGGNVFIKSLIGLLSGRDVNVSSDRESFFHVSGIGYIYQFRAILLPILSAFLLWGPKRQSQSRVVNTALFGLSLIFLLGTGQRNAFVFFCGFLIVYLLYSRKLFHLDVNMKHMILFSTIGALFMIVLTISNGRVASYNSENPIIGAILSLTDRFFGINSRSAITAFSYIDGQETAWGYDWLMMAADLLPGKSGYLSVDRITYYIAYGTYNGTGPPCIWGSAWYNWSFFGVTIFPLLLGFMYQNIYWHFRKKTITPWRLFIYSAKVIYFGIWFAGTPMFLFNNGAVAVSFLAFLTSQRVKFRKTRTNRASMMGDQVLMSANLIRKEGDEVC